MKVFKGVALACATLQHTASWALMTDPLIAERYPVIEERSNERDLITWDNQSLIINGEHIMIWSGEFHPFRLPVPSLYIDVFQKIKALGFNCVSFYVNWALLEGQPGSYSADGIFALEPFFEAASEAGIYLLARPGPYINAEVSGGGFPGWLQRVKGVLRSTAPDYLAAIQNYMSNVSATIAKAQLINGGPVILYQAENEYTQFCCGVSFEPQYMQDVINIARDSGIVVPFLNNDQYTAGEDVPGSGIGAVDIYGWDSYPIGFDCNAPDQWIPGSLPTNQRETHLRLSPSTPFALVESQGGSYDNWGGTGFDSCAALMGPAAERMVYKNNLASGVMIMNNYMVFGGTNWGNLGEPEGYTSYDYGSAISEDRTITREKYSELKLIANFIKVSRSYLDMVPGSASTGYSTSNDLTITPLKAGRSPSSFYIVRHADYTDNSVTGYQLKVPSSHGNLTIPQLGGNLSLNGRDSKIHVVDYDVAGINLLYSTAEIFTWKNFANHKVLVIYGGEGEHHEFAISFNEPLSASVVEGPLSGVTVHSVQNVTVVAWDVGSTRRIIKVGNLLVLCLDRNSVFDYWVPELSTEKISPGFSNWERTSSSLLIKAGYLVRSASLQGNELHIAADFNTTTTIEIIGIPQSASRLFINGHPCQKSTDVNGFWTTTVTYQSPTINLPDLETLNWKYVDSLPEIQPLYDDSKWPSANNPTTNNTIAPLKTPTSLYSSDYGFHTGSLLYRGYFTAAGNETSFSVATEGGFGFASSIWLNQTYIGSFSGGSNTASTQSTYRLPKLVEGSQYTFTIVIDHMGMEENGFTGADNLKMPRGILDYELSGRNKNAITWKITGNLGGEDYQDRVRGPLNEGAFYAERQGWHQPYPPSQDWKQSSPSQGLTTAGVGLYASSFDLNLPTGWDIPLSIIFNNGTRTSQQYRVQLYVNGYQFGKYIDNIGPQTTFPIPQGILNYQGSNSLALTVWAQSPTGAKLGGIKLEYRNPVITALSNITSSEQPGYLKRAGAY